MKGTTTWPVGISPGSTASPLASEIRSSSSGTPAAIEAAHAKKFATRVAFAGIAECMQAMGAAGLHQDHVLARHLACAKAAQYMDGSTEIQNVVLGRHLHSRYGTPAPPEA